MSDLPEYVSASNGAAQRTASPFRLNLEQQRKRAKELLRALRSGDLDALKRFNAHHPQTQRYDASAVRLSNAQLVIARELGLPSWPKLKAHITAMDRSWDRIRRSETAPDHEMTTLHIRCGHDIEPTLRQAGFAGDFLAYADPICHGPLLNDEHWLERRADFLAHTYGSHVARRREEIFRDLTQAEETLQAAATNYERVVLWFEHDTYDQLILARCLAQFAQTTPRRLELVSASHFPGAMRFIGLGQLPPEALRLLWNNRESVSDRQLQSGASVWGMLRADDPRPLAETAAAGMPELPQLAVALKRHCQELPWTRDGLSLTERLILQLVAEQPRTVAEVFSALMMQREPLPFMTDLMMLFIVDSMKKVRRPVFHGTFSDDGRSWHNELLTITPLGGSVLTGESDWLSLHPPVRWSGGVCIDSDAPGWRWNDAAATIVKR